MDKKRGRNVTQFLNQMDLFSSLPCPDQAILLLASHVYTKTDHGNKEQKFLNFLAIKWRNPKSKLAQSISG